MLVVFNKLDLPAAREAWPTFRRAREAQGLTVVGDLGRHRRRTRRAAPAPRRPPAGCRGARGATGACGRRRPPHRGHGRRLRGRRRGGRHLPGPRRTDRADRGPDELRCRGVRRTVPARPGAPRYRCRAAPGGHRTRRPRAHRRLRARVGTRGSGRTGESRPGPGSSAGRSTRSTLPTSPSPRRPARPPASSASSSCRRACRHTRRAWPSPRPRTGSRWSSSRSPDNPAFVASRIELDRPGPSYTADTLAALAAEPATGELSLILSAETFLELPRLARPRPHRRAGTAHRGAARRLPRGGPGVPQRPLRGDERPGRSSSTGRTCGSPPRSFGRGRRPGARCAISCPMRSPPISATMRSIDPTRRDDRS